MTANNRGETGDKHEWRFLKCAGRPRMSVSELRTHFGKVKNAFRNRHSGQALIFDKKMLEIENSAQA